MSFHLEIELLKNLQFHIFQNLHVHVGQNLEQNQADHLVKPHLYFRAFNLNLCARENRPIARSEQPLNLQNNCMVRRRTLIQTRKDRRGIPYVASVAPPAKACLGYPRPACMVSQGVKVLREV